MSDKYQSSNDFYGCFLGRYASINKFGKVLLFPIILLGYSVFVTMDFLFSKGD
jgi:hypothetical protein